MTHSYFLFLVLNPNLKSCVIEMELLVKKKFLLQNLIVLVTIALVCGPIDNCIEKQYKYKDICCPKCNPGHRVQKHCENDSGTTCHPCENNTHQDSFNGDEKCIPCSACGEGTYPIKYCTTIRDAVCDCSEGFHCENITTDGCEKCTKHSTCKLGEMQTRKGSYRKDTVCLPSPPGSNVPEETPTKPPKAGTNDKENGRTGHTPESSSADSTVVILSIIIGILTIIIMFLMREYFLNWFHSAIGACLKQDTRERAEAGLQKPVQEEIQEHGQDLAVSIEEQSPLTHLGPIHDFADDKLLSKKGVMQLENSAETVHLSSVKTFNDAAE